MKIADEYFERLLASTDAIDAITQLDQVWCARPGISAGKPSLGLAEPEYDIHLVLLYTGAVVNGGHSQFFEGALASLAADTVRALRRIGSGALAETLQGAADRTISFSAADSRFDSAALEIDTDLLRYARLHRDEICVPERED